MVDIVPIRREGRRRTRKALFKFEREEIGKRVQEFHDRGLSDRDQERELHLQRYAKYRMWVEGKDFPWPNASDIPLPDMTEKSLKVQDTLHNAVMSSRPPIGASAVQKQNKDKERTVDQLIDYQIFVEQNGEKFIGDLADAFANDGHYVVFIPWVNEKRETIQVKTFNPIPDEVSPVEYFSELLRQTYPGGGFVEDGRSAGWDWRVTLDNEDFKVRFFTKENDDVELLAEREIEVFDGPLPIVKDWEDVLFPVRAANLQIPSPSNPGGAAHVILKDYPTIDEIKRLKRSGWYALMTEEEEKELENFMRSGQDEEEKAQKDNFQGVQDDQRGKAKPQNRLTRLMCFDIFDIDGDGIQEDVIWWYLVEPKLVVKAALLTELYPLRTPKRPLASESFIPVRGRVSGISQLELIEGLHDSMKMAFDQMVDSGTVSVAPFGFYRPSGGMKPEVIRMAPGELYPLNDPARDINFPSFNLNSQGFGINIISLLGSMEDRLTTVGDLQLGGVPAGRSAALRTTGNMALLLGQGEARPERILRRFFMGLASVWQICHELNQVFLPRLKQIRISGVAERGQDPYLEIARSDLDGVFNFDFQANILNTTKAQLQQSLTSLMQVVISPLLIQMGITDAETVFRLTRDFSKAFGVDAFSKGYIKEPIPGIAKPRLFAEDALSIIISGSIPDGTPAEGAVAHFQKLAEFSQTGTLSSLPSGQDNLGLLTPEQNEILKGYMQQTAELAALEQQQAQLAQSAQSLNQGLNQGQPGAPASQPANIPGQPTVSSGNELLDETLPAA